MKLKPCPFCGGVAVQRFSIWGESYAYGCYTTGCMGNVHNYTSGFKTDKEAIEAWNRRKPLEDIVEQLEEYEGTWSGRNRRDEYKDCDYEGGCAGCVNCKTEDAYRTAIEIVKSGGAM